MRLFCQGVGVVLFFHIGLSGCQANPQDDAKTASPQAAPATGVAAPAVDAVPFTERSKTLEAQGNWSALLEAGREWETAHPDDPTGVFAQARAAHLMGDVETAIPKWEQLIAMDAMSAQNGAAWLKTARGVRQNFPNLKFLPLEYGPRDASQAEDKWKQQGEALLVAQKYDEIEKIAADLQKSGASNTKGSPLLSFFFEGLSDGFGSDFATRQKRIAAWRAARPQSNLARLAELEMWGRAASLARGSGYSDTMTPAMQAKVDAALVQSTRRLKNLPASAFDSPLAFVAALNCGLQSGAPRQYLDQMFVAGTRKFPNYLSLYRTRSIHLLPRWFGEPGESLAMIENRADQIGGEAGDIFYARVIWHLMQNTGNLKNDFSYSPTRAARGLSALQKRFPASLSVQSARLNLAFRNRDWKTAQQILTSPTGHKLDTAWELWAVTKNQNNFAEQRMLILATAAQ